MLNIIIFKYIVHVHVFYTNQVSTCDQEISQDQICVGTSIDRPTLIRQYKPLRCKHFYSHTKHTAKYAYPTYNQSQFVQTSTVIH